MLITATAIDVRHAIYVNTSSQISIRQTSHIEVFPYSLHFIRASKNKLKNSVCAPVLIPSIGLENRKLKCKNHRRNNKIARTQKINSKEILVRTMGRFGLRTT